MLRRLGELLRSGMGYRSILIEDDTPGRLTLVSGSMRTTFDRTTNQIRQNDKIVAMLPLVTQVELSLPLNQDGPPNWFITVLVQGARQVHVGQEFDQTSASIVGARISTVTGKPVVAHE
jgi:hypothetical protein